MSKYDTIHQWTFFRAGGFDQVAITSGDDVANLGALDQKLWSALACPTSGLEFDSKTLALIDDDGDGRIRAPEIVAASTWATDCLRDNDQLMQGGSSLSLSAIDASNSDGKRILASAKQILADLGKPDAQEIAISDVADTAALFAQTQFNGDGIVTPESADDEATRSVIVDIVACSEPVEDRSGKPGIDDALVTSFFESAAAFLAWSDATESDATILPLGDGTAAASAAVQAVASKVDDFFARCQLAAFDARAVDALNREESEYLALAAKDLSITPDEVEGLPLARIGADATLPLGTGINPAWSARIDVLRAAVVEPLVGTRDGLDEATWRQIIATLAPYAAWQSSKAGAAVEGLGIERVRAVVDSDAKAAIDTLIDLDLALADEADAIGMVDRLLHYKRDLVTLLNNFVSFRDFYSPEQKAIFQAGTMLIDQRSCDLCIEVSNAGKHGTMAPLSRAYVAVCEVVRKSTGQKKTIAAAFTGGDTDFLMVGKNGIFYDRDGNDWDATITKIIDNPLSIRQAFFSPYKKALRAIEAAIAKRAQAADKASDAKLAGAQKGATGAAKGAPPPKAKFDVGIVAALGVAVGGIVAALGALLQAFFGLGMWMPLGLLALVLIISGPSMVIAWLKLRQRNIGPLLDANGWAVNAQAKVNRPFGKSLTQIAKLPAGSKRNLKDPFAESRTPARLAMAAAILLAFGAAWASGGLDGWLPDSVDASSVIGFEGMEAADNSAS